MILIIYDVLINSTPCLSQIGKNKLNFFYKSFAIACLGNIKIQKKKRIWPQLKICIQKRNQFVYYNADIQHFFFWNVLYTYLSNHNIIKSIRHRDQKNFLFSSQLKTYYDFAISGCRYCKVYKESFSVYKCIISICGYRICVCFI